MYIAWQILKRDLLTLLFPRSEKTGKRGFSLAIQWILSFAFWGGLFYAGLKLFGYTYSAFSLVPEVRDAININLLNATALASFFMVFLMGFQWSYKTIYESDDLQFLLSLPIEASSVFLAKFLSSYSGLSLSALTFSLPIWLSFGVVEKAGFTFYALTILGFLVFVLFGNAAISFLLLLAMRFIPGRKFKQLFVALTAIFGILIVLISQVISARAADEPGKMLTQIGEASFLNSPYLPTTWVVRSVMSSIPRLSVEGLVSTVVLFGSGIASSFLVIRLSESWYLKGWAGKTEEASSEKRRKVGRVASRPGLFSGLQGSFFGILKKDMRLFIREPLVWYSLAISAIVLAFFIFNVSQKASTKTPLSESMHITGAMLIMMAGMISSVTGSQVGGISISREGQSFWVVRANLGDLKGFFWAKAVYALLPSFVLTFLFLFAASFLPIPQYPLWRSLSIGFALVSIIGVFQLLLDVYFPDFTMKMEFGSNTKTQRGTGKVLVSMFGSWALMALLIVILVSPSFLGGFSLFKGYSTETLVWMSQGTIVLLGLVSLGVWYPLSKKRLARLFYDT